MPDPATVGSWSASIFPVLAGIVLVPAAIVLAISVLVSAAYAATAAEGDGE